MTPKQKILFSILLIVDLALLAIPLSLIFFPSVELPNFLLLNPKGQIAVEQRKLLITAVLLMLIVAVPVFIFTAFIVFKYKAKNASSDYNPNSDHRPLPALVLWAIPSVIIFIIAGIVWQSTHALDPHKPIVSNVKPITIQVIALQWKWLFIYPEENIATVNFVQFPENTPLNFLLTADEAAMNSFWIPELGGQMYAMTGMSNKHHLIANHIGEFQGSTAEMSGKGFASMRFMAKSTTVAEFEQWKKTVQQSAAPLDLKTYNELVKPSESNPAASYSSVEKDLYNTVIMKYMAPSTSDDGHDDGHLLQMEGMQH